MHDPAATPEELGPLLWASYALALRARDPLLVEITAPADWAWQFQPADTRTLWTETARHLIAGLSLLPHQRCLRSPTNTA